MFLNRTSFEADTKDWTMPWGKVQSIAPCASWYSPSATNWMVPFADLLMLRQIKEEGLEFEVVSKAWMGSALHLANMIAFRCDAPSRLKGWYLGLQHFDTSVVLAWPLRRAEMPGHPEAVFFEPLLDVSEPVGIFVHEMDGLMACALEVWSPLRQWIGLPRSHGHVPSCSRLFQRRAQEALSKVLARSAYFDLNLSALHMLAKHRGCCVCVCVLNS